jgi:hypothetical protein
VNRSTDPNRLYVLSNSILLDGLDLKRTELPKPPDWNEVPEYGIEALISTIDDERELIAAIRREARWHEKPRSRDSNKE